MVSRTPNFVFLIFCFLICLNILAWIVVWDLNQPHLLEVNFFDVGQGDAIFIETPKRYQILIDGGPDSTILEKLRKKMPFWDRSIDLIILTHPEEDHLAGLLEVLKRYKIENILWTGIIRNTPEYKEWVKLIEREKAEIKIAQANQKIKAGKVYFEILYPFENLEGKTFKNINNTSIVSRLVFNENSFLFTGDIYRSVEEELIREYSCSNLSSTSSLVSECKGAILDSDVLKVAHHGSRTSTAEDFLREVSPEIAIIQVGKNKYGHPHPEALERLEKFGTKILRTDFHGDINIISDGITLKYGVSYF
ncbi:MAG: ComEC/Rec2 family competence protein [Patescibacteria group bacterium]|nr:ComEC/Rec2 family competence protein [Patescibacteria group bacterium]